MIQMTEVVKRFGTYTALNGLGCEIENETIYGLVGPNGLWKIDHAAADRRDLPCGSGRRLCG